MFNKLLKSSINVKCMVCGALFIIILFSGCLSSIHLGEGYDVVTVKKKFIDVSDEGSHYVLVTDKGLFEVDRPLLDMFDPTRNPDLAWAKIEEGKTYKIHYYGYRIDFIYDYPIVVGTEKW